MRTIISITVVTLFFFTLVSGCTPSPDQSPSQDRRPCATTKDSEGRELELVMEKTGETLHLGVYQDGVPKEIVTVLITDRRPYGVVVKKDGEVIFDERFVIPEEEEISTPMELSLAQIEEGKAKDPALNPIVEVAREMPQLEYMPVFAEVLPVRVYWESMYSGLLEYPGGEIAQLSFNGQELNECTEDEQERQYWLRMNSCDQSWQDYITYAPPRDTDCLLCSLVAIDPCTGQPIDSQAFLGCIFGGPIGCGVSIGIAIILWSSSAY